MVVFNWRLIFNLAKLLFFPPHPSVTAISQSIAQQSDNSLVIPELGISVPVIDSTTDPLTVTDWSIIKKDLMRGVSLSIKRAKPGESGTSVIVGHSSDLLPHTYAAVFAPLGEAKTGQLISLKYHGKQYSYRVTNKEVVSPTDLKFFDFRLNQKGNRNQLLLITCWPILTTQKRLVVSATIDQSGN